MRYQESWLYLLADIVKMALKRSALRDNGKENGSYYSGLFRVQCCPGHFQGLQEGS